MKRTNKKGFTIVELVIVIAVIAILAAVLIPNISRLVKKAQISSDLSLVRNLNMALETESATMDYPTAYSAFQAVKENGYDIAKIEAKASNNQILYDEVNKCFAYMNGSKLEYYPNSTKSDKITPKHQLWMVVTSAEDAKNSEYSVYWNGASGAEITLSKAGFDAGDKTTKSVTYTGSQSVIIRTNGGDLIVNAPSGHVEHYGLAKTITVTAISGTTYVEYGTVAKMTVGADAKHVVIKAGAVVVNLDNTNASVSVESNGYVGTVTKEENITGSHGGNTIKVSTFDQLQGLALASTIGADVNGKTIELQNDIDASGRTWTPFGWNATKTNGTVTNAFTGTIDGKGHKITGLSSDGYIKSNEYTNTSGSKATPYALIAYATKNVTVKNLTLDVNFVQTENIKLFAAGVLASYDFDGITADGVKNDNVSGYQVLISNVTVNGTISGADQVAGIMGTNYVGNCDNAQYAAVSFTLENCTNNATLKSEGRVGGIVGKVSTNKEGYPDNGTTKRKAVSFEVVNCKNAAKSIETKSTKYGVGGVIGFLTNSCKDNALTKITNCTSETTDMKAPAEKCGKLLYNDGAGNKVTIDGTVYTCEATKAYDSVSNFNNTTN